MVKKLYHNNFTLFTFVVKSTHYEKALFYCAVLLAVLICVNQKAYAQLFTALSDTDAALTTEQQSKLDSLRLNPLYDSITMVQVGNIFSLQQNGILDVNLPGYPVMHAELSRIHVSEPSNNPE